MLAHTALRTHAWWCNISSPADAASAAASSSSGLLRQGREQARQLAVQKVVLALGSAEWRTALVRRGRVSVAVQLGSGPGLHVGLPASSAPAGMLTLQLELHPAFSAPLDQALLRSQQRSEAARDAEALAAFVAGAKAWWADYVKANLSFKARPVKVLPVLVHDRMTHA